MPTDAGAGRILRDHDLLKAGRRCAADLPRDLHERLQILRDAGVVACFLASESVQMPERIDATVSLIAVKQKRLQVELLEPRHEIPLLCGRNDVRHVAKTRGQLWLSEQITYCEIGPAGRLFGWNPSHPSIRLLFRCREHFGLRGFLIGRTRVLSLSARTHDGRSDESPYQGGGN